MVEAHVQLRRLLAGQGHGEGDFRWHHVLRLMERLRQDRSAASAAVLQEIAEYGGRLTFDGVKGHPHSMPPADLLRSMAVQILAQWDLKKYRGTIKRAAVLSLTHPARALARQVLSR